MDGDELRILLALVLLAPAAAAHAPLQETSTAFAAPPATIRGHLEGASGDVGVEAYVAGDLVAVATTYETPEGPAYRVSIANERLPALVEIRAEGVPVGSVRVEPGATATLDIRPPATVILGEPPAGLAAAPLVAGIVLLRRLKR